MQQAINVKNFTLKKILDSAKSLSTKDKMKLIKKISFQIEIELKVHKIKPNKSLRGLWKGIDIKDHDIQEQRKEMWQQFPREDI